MGTILAAVVILSTPTNPHCEPVDRVELGHVEADLVIKMTDDVVRRLTCPICPGGPAGKG